MRLSILGVLWSLICPTGFAQDTLESALDRLQPEPQVEWRVQNFTVRDGLPTNLLNQVIEDDRGFLWLNTWEGLTRYDGYEFKTYRSTFVNSSSIGRDGISLIHGDAAGNIWMTNRGPSNDSGVIKYEPQTGRFIQYQHNAHNPNSLMHGTVRAIHNPSNDPRGIWFGATDSMYTRLGTGGLSYLDVETGTFTNYAFLAEDPQTYPHLAYSIVEDADGVLWTGGWGLNRIERNSVSGSSMPAHAFSTFLPDPSIALDETEKRDGNLIFTVYASQMEPGVLWAFTGRSRLGLHRFDVATEKFTFFPFPEEIGSNFFIYEDSQGILWLGANEGLFNFDPRTGNYKRFAPLGNAPFVYGIEEDRFGVLWITTQSSLFKLERSVSPFSVYAHEPGRAGFHVRAVYLDRENMLWVGKRDTLQRIDRNTGEIRQYLHDPGEPASRSQGHYTNLYEDANGTLWLTGGCFRGISVVDRFDRSTAGFIHNNDPTRASGSCPNESFEDRHYNFWVVTWGSGLYLMDRQTGHFTPYRQNPDNPTSLINDFVLDLYEDRSGQIWLGTEEGMSRFDPSSVSASSEPVFTNYEDELLLRVMNMYEDRAGRFWVATASRGLHLFDRESGQIVETFTVEDGLASDIVWSIYEDSHGLLWLSTAQGISRFDPDARTFLTYDMRDGLPFDAFIERAHFQSDSGELFFGTREGVISFFPDQMAGNPLPPEVHLTGFSIEGVPVAIGSDGPLAASIGTTETIELAHDQNNLTFDYVGLHSIDPLQIQYRYQLDGYDPGWVEAGPQRSARYPRLPPGDYVFQVNAASNEGVWNETGASVRVTINPPWWRTIFAYVVYGALIAIGIFAVDRFQRRRLIARERLRAEREKAKAIESTNNELQRALKHLTETQDQLVHTEKMASLGQLTAGIAHEIKNPLNFVNNFAQIASNQAEEIETILEEERERLSTENAHELKELIDDLRVNAQKINEHGQRADGIIRSMLEHSRTERGKQRPVNINKLVDEYVNLAYHGIRAREQGIDILLNRDYDPSIGEIEIYPQEIGRVLINLLENAFYAVSEKQRSQSGAYTPEVWVSTKKTEGGYVELRIRDNGPGIPEAIREKIFEPFFTTKPAGSGTGLGLSLSYDIVVKGHGGSMTVEYADNRGATFVVVLPLKIITG